MNHKLIIALSVVLVAVGTLVFSAIANTQSKQITVAEILASKKSQTQLRLGAKVAEGTIDYKGDPDFLLTFFVKDIVPKDSQIDPSTLPTLKILYQGIMPDTLVEGRDVIMEGSYDGEKFIAKNLVTQCPSKYEPPLPGTADAGLPESEDIKEHQANGGY
jgi:cytochrome c-type biogenesis protein CcmE